MRTQTNIINEKIAALKVAKLQDSKFICIMLKDSFSLMNYQNTKLIQFVLHRLEVFKLHEALILCDGHISLNIYITNENYLEVDTKEFKHQIIDKAIYLLEQEKSKINE